MSFRGWFWSIYALAVFAFIVVLAVMVGPTIIPIKEHGYTPTPAPTLSNLPPECQYTRWADAPGSYGCDKKL